MSSSEERERRRAERLAAERAEAAAARRRLIAGYAVAGALALAVVVGLVIVLTSGDGDGGPDAGDFPSEAYIQPLSGSVNGFEPDDREPTEPPELAQGDLERAAEVAGCELRLDLPPEGNGHLSEDEEPPRYDTNPPTSGDHIESPLMQADGAYAERPDDKYVVHSLEHGRVAVQYSPDLPEADQLAIKGVFAESPEGMLLFPNDDSPYAVAATAWTNLLGCESYEGAATLDAIRDFRDTFRGRGPEDVPLITG